MMRKKSLGSSEIKNELRIAKKLRTSLDDKRVDQKEQERKTIESSNILDRSTGKNLDLNSQSIALKFPSLKKQSFFNQKVQKKREWLQSNSNDRLSSRQQSPKKKLFLSQLPETVSPINKRLVESFLNKLALTEQYALTNRQAYHEYIEMIYKLRRNQADYLELVRKKKKRSCFDIESNFDQSPSNKQLKSELSEDMHRIRSFASKYKFSIYRKDHLGQSLDSGSTQRQISNKKTKKKLQDTFKPQFLSEKIEQNKQVTNEMGTKEEIQSFDVFFPSLKSRKREAMNKKERYQLGVGYLKGKGRMKEKSPEKKQEEKGKIKFLKQIVHHWKVDNRFLIVKTEEDQDIPEPITTKQIN